MLFQLLGSVESHPASVTAIRFELEMTPFMVVFVAISGEFLPTIRAGKQLLACVDPFVLQEACLVLKYFPTGLKWALVWMFEYIKQFQ